MLNLYDIYIQLSKRPRFQSTSSSRPEVVPESLFDPLPSHSPAPISKRRDTLRTGLSRDYRFGPIRIDWVEFEVMSDSATSSKPQSEEWNTPAATFIPSVASSSGTTNLPEGIVRIFRERSSAVLAEPSSPSISKVTHNGAGPSNSSQLSETSDSTTVAVLAVPFWMTPSDFLAFVAPAAEGMKHLRLIRDTSPNRTMVVIQFREAAGAQEFIDEFNGRQFNSVEPEICNVVRVNSVKIEMDDPVSHVINRTGSNLPTLYELPTCPVCLDRMDASVTGLVTVPCSHTFHCMCLSKWGDSRCPVCRYSQIALSSTKPAPSGMSYMPPLNSTALAHCSECDSRFNLWICLICGNIGCGRQGRAHAKGHYELTTHLYAMELETQRVWDYAGDNYVHRLIQNKADGKLVELPPASNMENQVNGRHRPGQGPGEDDNLKAEKMEVMAMQYSQILQRAMDDQRQTYEEQTAELRRKLEDAQRKMEILSGDVERRLAESAAEQVRRQKEEDTLRVELERERAKAEKRAEKMGELARRYEKELREERAMNAGLLTKLASQKERLEAADKEKEAVMEKVKELEDQMRDVMFFLEARDKIDKGEGIEAEAAGGSIEIVSQPTPSTPLRNGTGTKKKKKK